MQSLTYNRPVITTETSCHLPVWNSILQPNNDITKLKYMLNNSGQRGIRVKSCLVNNLVDKGWKDCGLRFGTIKQMTVRSFYLIWLLFNSIINWINWKKNKYSSKETILLNNILINPYFAVKKSWLVQNSIAKMERSNRSDMRQKIFDAPISKIYYTVICQVVLYGFEWWPITKSNAQVLNTTDMEILKWSICPR